ncbi:LuxR C-terminal-related transcriptional regulator [Streptomyces sp. LHD-70]|uniref:LuxR C-terminal-related transcriptional regulator n=1 Tax=Streptomyces sp. LHD-70 TaxID=3072140 RepID=UPI002810295E|nr:LuxR C-terminal-related transcriptional regulator [Streptomyces sp. LHD-70]MDQ8706934.1 LuxR C-terminal-related transcriptional regulator [Streptomyces sp. LHD-70]
MLDDGLSWYVRGHLEAGGGRHGRGPLAPLLGRAAELSEMTRQLTSDDTGPLTLTGPVGVGKSRLAAAVFRHLGSRFERACLAELDTVDPQGDGRAADLLHTAAADGTTLLVLDGGTRPRREIAPLVARLACAADGTRILTVTPRALGLYGERRLPLAPLAVPTSADAADLQRLGRVPSVRLLLDRTRSVRPGFRLSDGNRGAVAELTRRLDGLPLAVELAAARLKVASPAQLLRELDASPDALRGTPADTTSAHLTMGRALEQSWQGLAPGRRELLARVAVFAASFDADDVAGTLRLSAGQAHGVLDELLDRNLVVSEEQPDGGLRFRMPGLTRAHARAFLTRRDAWEPVCRGHAAYLLRHTPTALPLPDGGPRPEAGPRDPEVPDGVPEGVPDGVPEGVPDGVHSLTPREQEVAELVAEGLTNREVARQLGIAEWTAVNTLRKVMRKLGCPSRVHVANRLRQTDGRPTVPPDRPARGHAQAATAPTRRAVA